MIKPTFRVRCYDIDDDWTVYYLKADDEADARVRGEKQFRDQYEKTFGVEFSHAIAERVTA